MSSNDFITINLVVGISYTNWASSGNGIFIHRLFELSSAYNV